ncbi:hypothetical protein JYU34_018029 [Plutella xylostella]|uniref:LRRK2 beta-propeller domain-containing protein n=2 Tax=Plutella xylostella TaxID=51655 RepID=A0ABQ7PZJ9_PLUXY|nr:hypothetical protein JYU34_018029 [Plutella xylostella]
MRSEIYIGTAWGCVVVAEAATLRPITVFRPHEGPIRSIIPLHPHKQSEVPMIMTIGTGYRPLLQRFVPQAQNTSNATNTATGSYCLLWRALNWMAE